MEPHLGSSLRRSGLPHFVWGARLAAQLHGLARDARPAGSVRLLRVLLRLLRRGTRAAHCRQGQRAAHLYPPRDGRRRAPGCGASGSGARRG